MTEQQGRHALKTPPHHTTWPELLATWQAADDMDFSRTVGFGFQHALADHFVGKDVRLLRLQVRPERAERAAVDADVRGVKVRVDVVEGAVAVESLAHDVGQRTHFVQRRFGAVQEHPFFAIQAFSRLHLVPDFVESSGDAAAVGHVGILLKAKRAIRAGRSFAALSNCKAALSKSGPVQL